MRDAGDEEDADTSNRMPVGEDGEPIDLDTNRCDLVWEGPIKEKSYTTFRSKSAESDKIARDFLGAANQGYWDVGIPSCRFTCTRLHRLD